MSRELTNFYRSLADDTDPRGLAAPELVRRRADSRARTRAVAGVLAVAALVGGTAVGAQLVLAGGAGAPVAPPADTPGPPSVSPSPSPSPPAPAPTPSAAPPSAARSPSRPVTSAPPAVRTPTSIPDRAFFVQARANDIGVPPRFTPGPVLPALCGAETGQSGIVQQRARTLAFKLADTPQGHVPDGSYRHSITIYRPGRADDALRELRQAVRDCPKQEVPGSVDLTSRQRLLDGGDYGDEAVLFELRQPYRDSEGEPTGGDAVRLVRAVRVGDVVTVLWEQGWEESSSPRSQVDDDSRRAVAAVREWLT